MFLENSPLSRCRMVGVPVSLVLLAVLLFGVGNGTACAQPPAPIDINGNGMDDIWEMVFNAGGLNPTADTDGDGKTNLEESIGGTDPRDGNSVLRAGVTVASGTATITFPTVIGKLYQPASSLVLGSSTAWTDEGSPLAGTGGIVTVPIAAPGTREFFRVAVSDVDTDGDGVSDWDELQVGFDPTKPSTNGIDNDRTAIINALAATNVITVSAPVSAASEIGPMAGTFLITRKGNLNAIAVNYAMGGTAISGGDYVPLSGSVTLPRGVNTVSITVMPIVDAVTESAESATLTVVSNAAYTVGTPGSATVIIRDSTAPAGTGLTADYFSGSSSTYTSTANFNPTTKINRIDPTVNFDWTTVGPDPVINRNGFSARWTGQVQPQYSGTYTFVTHCDDGVKLWVNWQPIVDWWFPQGATDRIGTIDLLAGVRYDIKMEYYQGGGGASAQLLWYCPDLAKEVIPQNRLYPASVPPAPTAITSPASAVALTNGPFSYQITGSNLSTTYSATGLPAGLTLNTSTGLISGTLTTPGTYYITLTATNAVGTGAGLLTLQVVGTGGVITRDYWGGIAGTSISTIPVTTSHTATSTLSTFEGPAETTDNYGERIRGYLTAPVTGNYYFWIAASDKAELWISDDDDPVNRLKRASVVNGTTARNWTSESNQKSPWLALVAGQKYYIEVLHKAGVGTGDNVSVGWMRPDQTGTASSGVIPGYALSPYTPPVSAIPPGTLYSTTMLAQGTIASAGVGKATLRLSADETQAVLSFSYSNLSSAKTGEHIHSDPYLGKPGVILFDIDTTAPQSDGTYIWPIVPAGTLTTADIVEVIKQGKAYINIHTANNLGGEIRGNFTLTNGTQTFVPPPADPGWTDDPTKLSAAASRFLIQSTFGPSQTDIAAVLSMGYDGWITDQFNKAVSHHLPVVMGSNVNPSVDFNMYSDVENNAWWMQSITAPDQLRQRVAFALSEIFVISQATLTNVAGVPMAHHYDALLDNAFGNFRQILEAASLTPAMGLYLDMRGNDKENGASGVHPNENYAREIMQLFSIGLYRLWPDGTLVLNAKGNLVDSYDQQVVEGYARVFTGWNWNQPLLAGRLPTGWYPRASYRAPMVMVPTHHEPGAKRILNNVVLPAATGAQADSTQPAYDTYALQDWGSALDAIAAHPNVGPFICRQLIQRLVTSNPSRGYLYRVVQKFNDNGSGVRGDMQAVIRTILLDYEARSSDMITVPTYGKQREPLLRVTAAARAFPPPAPITGTYTQSGSQLITVNTATPHRFQTNENVQLDFGSGTPFPMPGSYTVTNTGTNSFTVNARDMIAGTYVQSGTTMTVTSPTFLSYVAPGFPLYLKFLTGGAASAVYTAATVSPDGKTFTAPAPDSVSRSGSCQITYYYGSFEQSNTTTVTVYTRDYHQLAVGDNVAVHFFSGTVPDGVYPVASIVDPYHYTITAPASQNLVNFASTAPVAGPPLSRSGNISVRGSTWQLFWTDNDIAQTPMGSPTVFNYFFPSYQFPGILSSAGLTTPEFQLSSESNVIKQENFLTAGILYPNSSSAIYNSFNAGSGALLLDLSPYFSQTADTSILGLVDQLNTLLMAGQMTSAMRSTIVSFVANTANFPYSATPTTVQQRDRVRAIVQLIITSPDYTIQK